MHYIKKFISHSTSLLRLAIAAKMLVISSVSKFLLNKSMIGSEQFYRPLIVKLHHQPMTVQLLSIDFNVSNILHFIIRPHDANL